MNFDFDFEDEVTFEEDGVVFVEDTDTGDYTVYLADQPEITSEIKRGERGQAREILDTIADAIGSWDDDF